MDYVLLGLTGAAAGVLGGLLGVGGSSVMLPAMVLILGARNAAGKEQIQQYMAAAMIVNFLLILPSVLAHVRQKAVWPKVWAWLSAAAIVGIIAGVQLSYRFRSDAAKQHLRWSVGVFFLYVVGHNLYRLFGTRRAEGVSKEQAQAQPAWRKILVGLPMGVIAGLLGIGGGSLAVPGQQIVLRMPLRNAIATSAATIASISWLGAIVKNVQLGEHGTVGRSLLLAGCLAPAAMVGAYLGGRLTHALPLRVVRIVFIALMIVSALTMFGVISPRG
ncbi:MAG: hypothetical protein AMJ81_05785 [Phycisphaerae bacterium SM23_33]|nr:MAG: hypothetical protein AMJ81_05785 [Phycisphaerae bacterium SM23_33]